MTNSHISDTDRKGLFVVFEGGEGSGKSTQARHLAEALEWWDIPNHLTREPGSTALGKRLRSILLDGKSDPISRKAELLLFAADRAEHVEKVIKPQLDRGKVVICDRYIASTMAYQVYAGGLDKTFVQIVSDWSSSGLVPDVTYFLDVEPLIGLERTRERGEQNRFEDKDVSYHDKVRRGFLRQRDHTWITVDAQKSIEDIHDRIRDLTLSYIRQVNAIEPLVDSTYRAAIAKIRHEATKKSGFYFCPACNSPLNPFQNGHYCKNYRPNGTIVEGTNVAG